MKTLTATLLAAALALPGLSAPAMAQQPKPQQHEQQKPQAQSQKKATAKPAQKQTYKTFRKGEKFEQRYARNYQVIDYRKYKKLPAPKRGYRYVRAGSDVLLIGTTTFKIYAVYSGLIR
ncbi:RcnB family protein [Novosphingobium album (ex Hu et al. 2023)]|uniref:RcnB family protein n=1 Tax=Novosphingobium album (ex Hu et al. 2023) TaxID=2930093 RepID=A0ABT0AZZ9_9SPHN|nr:RcnB family protein [Novosphingobium album (ex Hu et al. 2023)]MCJ2178109.1 RcnB family protein [Novosphingobium album (ex Hu et al. 2023)]